MSATIFICFQKQISCFVEYKNDKERKMAKGKRLEELNCQLRIKNKETNCDKIGKLTW